MDRRNFIAAGISAFLFALMPWLRPKEPDFKLPDANVSWRTKPISVQEYETWANYAMWQMCRGYDFRWQIGQHMNILDESLLRATAGTTGGTRVTPACSKLKRTGQYV